MKVALCIPCQGYTQASFALALALLVAKTLKRDPALDMAILMAGSSILPESRNTLVTAALASEADYLLLMDADHVFPPDSLLRLLGHRCPVVGANYARRAQPTGPTARRSDGSGRSIPIYTTEEAAQSGELEEVDQIGMGLCLINASVFRAIGEPWFDFVREGRQLIGEDTYFCQKARAAGFPIVVDHALSWKVGHVHSRVLTHRDALREGPLRDRAVDEADQITC